MGTDTDFDMISGWEGAFSPHELEPTLVEDMTTQEIMSSLATSKAVSRGIVSGIALGAAIKLGVDVVEVMKGVRTATSLTPTGLAYNAAVAIGAEVLRSSAEKQTRELEIEVNNRAELAGLPGDLTVDEKLSALSRIDSGYTVRSETTGIHSRGVHSEEGPGASDVNNGRYGYNNKGDYVDLTPELSRPDLHNLPDPKGHIKDNYPEPPVIPPFLTGPACRITRSFSISGRV